MQDDSSNGESTFEFIEKKLDGDPGGQQVKGKVICVLCLHEHEHKHVCFLLVLYPTTFKLIISIPYP